jgi:hypothetical protein
LNRRTLRDKIRVDLIEQVVDEDRSEMALFAGANFRGTDGTVIGAVLDAMR